MNFTGKKIPDFSITGIPDHNKREADILRSRISFATQEYLQKVRLASLTFTVTTEPLQRIQNKSAQAETSEISVVERSGRFRSCPPIFTDGLLVLPVEIQEEIETALDLIRIAPVIYKDWGLDAIERAPKCALNFHGPPGTGKTLAAHSIASRLKCSIVAASYADVESMYHGEGPKNMEALFYAAEQSGSILFIDEADSLLSKRLSSVSQASEQAINSMRSQLLLSLERFTGIVIFATNLVDNYDPAFDTRVRHIYFALPDESTRTRIWTNHLPPKLPVSPEVSISRLSKLSQGLCGREIKTAVLRAAVAAARASQSCVTQEALEDSITKVRAARRTEPQKKQTYPEELSCLTEEFTNPSIESPFPLGVS